MTDKRADNERFSLKRWSQRKLESAAKAPGAAPAPSAATGAVPQAVPAASSAPAASVELPPIESLTFDSDFTPFFKPEVDPALQRAALKQLFRDPRFNVMDGLDTYIDDYTKPDPIPSGMLAELVQRFDFESPTPAAGAVQSGAAAQPCAAPAERDVHLQPDVSPVTSSPVRNDTIAVANPAATAETGGAGTAPSRAQAPAESSGARDSPPRIPSSSEDGSPR